MILNLHLKAKIKVKGGRGNLLSGQSDRWCGVVCANVGTAERVTRHVAVVFKLTKK